MIALIAWFAELLLESAGCYFLFRRRFTLPCLWLGFRAACDLAGMVAFFFMSYRAYAWVDHWGRMGGFALLAATCAWCAGQVLREHPRSQKAYAWLLGALTVYAVVHFNVAPLTMGSMIGLELWVELVLAGLLCAAMGMANGKAPKPWGLIACGLVIHAGGDLVVTLARQAGYDLRAWYPLGAIAALIVLNLAGWRNYRLDEIRVSLPPRIECKSEGFGRLQSRMVH